MSGVHDGQLLVPLLPSRSVAVGSSPRLPSAIPAMPRRSFRSCLSECSTLAKPASPIHTVGAAGTITLSLLNSVPAEATAASINLTVVNGTAGLVPDALPDGNRPASGQLDQLVRQCGARQLDRGQARHRQVVQHLQQCRHRRRRRRSRRLLRPISGQRSEAARRASLGRRAIRVPRAPLVPRATRESRASRACRVPRVIRVLLVRMAWTALRARMVWMVRRVRRVIRVPLVRMVWTVLRARMVWMVLRVRRVIRVPLVRMVWTVLRARRVLDRLLRVRRAWMVLPGANGVDGAAGREWFGWCSGCQG